MLPKKHFSYSQMSLWLRNKQQYRERYYMDGASFESTETLFGKKTAQNLEKGISDPVLDKIPKYSSMEHKIELEIKGIPFLGYLDSFEPLTNSILEMKTGREPWNDVRVHKHDQLVIYSLLTKLKYKKVDPYVKLVWIETRYKKVNDTIGSRTMEGESNELEFTGNIQIFKRRIAEWERKRVKDLIIKTAQEISRDYSLWLHEQKNFFK